MAVREAIRGDHQAEALAREARESGVDDERLLDAIRTTPLSEFVPEDQVTTPPLLVAATIDALGLTGDEQVLEVGTGSGWQTALLAKLARRVWSIESDYEAAESAASALARQGIGGVRVIVGQGSRGLPGRAPYQAIVVAENYPRVPAALTRQLAPGGRLVQLIGDEVALFERAAGGLQRVR